MLKRSSFLWTDRSSRPGRFPSLRRCPRREARLRVVGSRVPTQSSRGPTTRSTRTSTAPASTASTSPFASTRAPSRSCSRWERGKAPSCVLATHDRPDAVARAWHAVGSLVLERSQRPVVVVGPRASSSSLASDVVVAVDGLTLRSLHAARHAAASLLPPPVPLPVGQTSGGRPQITPASA